MARVCIRIKANDHPTDAALTPLRTRLGDIVWIAEDGHVFSAAERNCGQYRFVDVPGVSQAALVDLMESENDAEGRMVKRRKWTLDSAVLSGVVWAGRTTATEAQIRSIVVARS